MKLLLNTTFWKFSFEVKKSLEFLKNKQHFNVEILFTVHRGPQQMDNYCVLFWRMDGIISDFKIKPFWGSFLVLHQLNDSSGYLVIRNGENTVRGFTRSIFAAQIVKGTCEHVLGMRQFYFTPPFGHSYWIHKSIP